MDKLVGRRIVLRDGLEEEVVTLGDFINLLTDLADTPEMWESKRTVEVSERIYEEGEGVPPSNFIGEIVYYVDLPNRRFGWKLNLCS